MARRVFFSFHFERDIWRVGQVRNSWLLKPDRETAGFWDAAGWEEVKKKGDDAIKRWIDDRLDGTSVTAVLIGAETNDREWVDYEIRRSSQISNGILGVYIHNIKDRDRRTDTKGKNPLDYWHKPVNGRDTYFSELYETYDWVNDNGYDNFGSWVEKAARDAGR